MPTKAFRFRSLLSGLLVIAGLSSGGKLATPSWSQENASYTIPNTDGYGIADCMRSDSECGRVMADSWCQAHGHAHALAYGASEDVTGSTAANKNVVRVAAGDIMIRCGD